MRNRAFSDIITQIVTRKVSAVLVSSLTLSAATETYVFLPASAVQLDLVRGSQHVGSRLPQARNIKGIIQLGGQIDDLHCLGFFSSCQQSLE